MKVLIVAPGDSSHTLTALGNLKTHYPNADFLFFNSVPFATNPIVKNYARVPLCDSQKMYHKFYWQLLFDGDSLAFSGGGLNALTEIVNQEAPDVIHYFCIQDAGYLVEGIVSSGAVKKSFKIVGSSFANDIFYFRFSEKHSPKLRKILEITDILLTENYRDLALAPFMGFKGRFVYLPHASTITKSQLLSKFPANYKKYTKSDLIIKGGNQLRSHSTQLLSILPAYIELFKIKNVHILMPDFQDFDLVEKLRREHSTKISVIEKPIANQQMVELLLKSKVAFSLNLSDGNPLFFFECIATGVYPVFSKMSSLETYKDICDITLVDPRSATDLASCLNYLAAKCDELTAICDRNFIALDTIDDRNVASALLSLYS